MKKYSKIGHLSTAIKNLINERQYIGLDTNGNPTYDKLAKLGVVEWIGTVKLHGTNSSIRHNFTTNSELTYYSREHVITSTEDNAGFALYMSTIESRVKALMACIRNYVWDRDQAIIEEVGDHDIVIFGEWAGQGIQKGVGVAQLPKMFFIFDICLVGKDSGGETKSRYLDMRKYKDVHYSADKIYNLWDDTKFPTYAVLMDLENPKLVQNVLVDITDQVESECPVAKYFGVSGIGEGVVYRTPSRSHMCKVKGSKHSKSKVRITNLVDTEKLNSVTEFVARFLDEERLEQAYQKMSELGHPYERNTIQYFIRWLIADIVEEEGESMVESGIVTKDIGGTIGKIASRWFISKIDEL